MPAWVRVRLVGRTWHQGTSKGVVSNANFISSALPNLSKFDFDLVEPGLVTDSFGDVFTYLWA